MTKFNPKGKDVLTYSECLSPAMKIVDQDEATQYLTDYVAFIQKSLDKDPRSDSMTAEEIAKVNLGYFAGYHDTETRLRVERLFHCSHPIFGNVSNGIPTIKEVFTAGLKLGQRK